MIGNAGQVWLFHFQHERRIHESLWPKSPVAQRNLPSLHCSVGSSWRQPPRISRTHHEYEVENKAKGTMMIPLNDVVQRCFFFGPREVASLRSLVPKHLGRCTTFEVITACMWRCRIRALQLDPDDGVRFIYTVNFTTKVNPPLPKGYYGNEFVLSAAVKTSRRLRENPLGYALELAKNVKSNVDEEYVLLDCVANCIRF